MNTLSLYLRKPFYATMSQTLELWFEPCTEKKIHHVICMLFYLVILPFTLILFGCAIILDTINQRPYIYLEGTGPIKTRIEQFVTWNVCMLFGSLSIPFGGVSRSSDRITAVAQEIFDKDLICLQEVSQDAAYNLFEALKSRYRFFYLKINPDPLFSLDSSLFIASKVPLTHVHVILLTQGDRIQRAAFSFNANGLTFITTHLDPHNPIIRRAQAERLTHADILLGDFNMTQEELSQSPLNTFHYAGTSDDFILSKSPITALSSQTSKKISDHYPMCATWGC